MFCGVTALLVAGAVAVVPGRDRAGAPIAMGLCLILALCAFADAAQRRGAGADGRAELKALPVMTVAAALVAFALLRDGAFYSWLVSHAHR